MSVQLAMMADASDEALGLTRFFDDSRYQLSELPAEIYQFILHCEYLFLQEPAGCICTGYTYYAIQQLQKAKVVWTSTGDAKTIGGCGRVTPELLGRCLARMAGWTRL